MAGEFDFSLKIDAVFLRRRFLWRFAKFQKNVWLILMFRDVKIGWSLIFGKLLIYNDLENSISYWFQLELFKSLSVLLIMKIWQFINFQN